MPAATFGAATPTPKAGKPQPVATPASSPSTDCAGGDPEFSTPHSDATPLYQAVDNEVCLGHGVCLPQATFVHLMTRPKDTVFVREACVRIFSTAGLVGRSVTGAASNRTKGDPKPSLDQEKYAALSDFFKHYLAERCTEQEVVSRHRALGKIVAMKIADVMKGQGNK